MENFTGFSEPWQGDSGTKITWATWSVILQYHSTAHAVVYSQ